MNDALLEPEEMVLSTLQRDGRRRWLKPKLSPGAWLRARRIVAWLLIVVFTVTPFIKFQGRPLFLFDIPAREFTLFGFTFLPTDTLLLAIFVVGALLSIFLFTALFGRVWCGWACPQTVYMEFLFRPIERLFEGTSGRGGTPRKAVPGWRIIARYAVTLLLCAFLANIFLAWFIGVKTLGEWMQQSPLEHPFPFLVMAFVTGAMMFDFCYFREQTCLIACPYGRFQSVLLDTSSLIVSYNSARGEPRGRAPGKSAVRPTTGGDCIDCGNCVTTCPTGIDIRNGLQMECINCTQCIDACNRVMKRIGRPPDLIRYSSQSRDLGSKSGLLRARTMIYPLLLIGLAAAFFVVLAGKKSFDAFALRVPGNPYNVEADGRVRNTFVIKLVNRTREPMSIALSPHEPADVEIQAMEKEIVLEARKSFQAHVSLLVPRHYYDSGNTTLEIRLDSDQGDYRILSIRVPGPFSGP
jgi:cytochrome c oxidase accessory protein FixG